MDDPTTLKLIGDVAGLEVLDVGCGLGSMARLLASRGASSILGVDISPAMVDRARKSTSSASVQYQVGQVQDLSEQASFDVIVSNLVAHFIEDYSGFLTEISRRLKPRGRAVISQRHPLRTARPEVGGAAETDEWPVSGYFDEGAKVYQWLGKEVTIYHRTFETVLNNFRDAGLIIESVREPQPVGRLADKYARLREAGQIPSILSISCVAARGQ